jgi:DNA-directed RNA polymerase specialized sigma24 family protein
LSYREIAEVTGLTVTNVGYHLHTAVRHLREAMIPENRPLLGTEHQP